MKNPQIYIVIATFFPAVGGAEKQAFAQALALRQLGYEATVITFRHQHDWPPYELLEGVPVVRVAGMLLKDRSQLPRLLQKVAYLLAFLVMDWTLWRHRFRYDILHVYGVSLLTWPLALLCSLAGKAMIVAVRNAGSDEITKSNKKLSLLAGPLDPTAPWLQVDGKLQASGRVYVPSDLEVLTHRGRFVVRLTRFLLQRAHAVLVVLSTRMKTSLAEHNFQMSDIQLIPNGVDITRFHPSGMDTTLAEREQVVVCVACLRYQKGIDVLLQAWHLVHKQTPQARLIIVGGGSLQRQLERMAHALSITESLEFAGQQSDIPAQLHRGNLAVLPSRWEGMPNALLEAMACGLACVATRVSGSEDIIQQGVNGLLVEPEDYQGMAEAILTLLRNPALVQQYGRAARQTIEQRYSFEQVMGRYIELYQRIAERQWQVTEHEASSKSWSARRIPR